MNSGATFQLAMTAKERAVHIYSEGHEYQEDETGEAGTMEELLITIQGMDVCDIESKSHVQPINKHVQQTKTWQYRFKMA